MAAEPIGNAGRVPHGETDAGPAHVPTGARPAQERPEASATPRGAPGVVGRDDLEAQLDLVRAAAAGPAEGVFGPGSMTWRIDREAALFLGAGRALLLQLAHPWVAVAIAEHSRALADPIGRFHRTFGTVFALAFGTLDQALAAARALHSRHGAVRGRLPETAGRFAAGSAYEANDVAALRWVWATLTETALVAHDLVSPPLREEERERYYAESRLFAALYGIPQQALPADWSAFAAYADGMRGSDTLAVGSAARDVAQAVLSGAGTWWLRAPGWYRALTAGMLPPRLRDGFGLPYGDAERGLAERATARIGRLYPALPARLRHVGPYQEAEARLGGRARPDAATRLLNRVWIGRPRLGA